MPPAPARSPQSVPGGRKGRLAAPIPLPRCTHRPAGRPAAGRPAAGPWRGFFLLLLFLQHRPGLARVLPFPCHLSPPCRPPPPPPPSSAPGRADTGLTASGTALKYIHITYAYNTHIYLYIHSVQVVVADSQPPQREVAGGCSPGAQVEAFCSWSSAFADFFPRNYCERKSGVEGLPPVPRSISAPCGSCGMLGSVGVVLAS